MSACLHECVRYASPPQQPRADACAGLQTKRSQAEVDAAAQDMLQDSGLLELEERILSWLCRNAGVLKLQASMDHLTLLASQVSPPTCPARQPILPAPPALQVPVHL